MKVAIILGSVREGRLGERVAKWTMNEAAKAESLELNLIDLKAAALPVFNDATVPGARTEPYADSAARTWSEVMAAADGYIFVTAEYNHTIPGALTNALDYLGRELTDKPAVIISYSTGPVGGARSAEHLSNALTYMRALVASVVSIGVADKVIDEAGVLAVSGPEKALTGAFARLLKLGALAK